MFCFAASLVTISLPLGSMIVGPLMDRFGRRKTIMASTIPFVIAWLIQANAMNVWHVYLARVLAGFSGGCVCCYCCVNERRILNVRVVFFLFFFKDYPLFLWCTSAR